MLRNLGYIFFFTTIYFVETAIFFSYPQWSGIIYKNSFLKRLYQQLVLKKVLYIFLLSVSGDVLFFLF